MPHDLARRVTERGSFSQKSVGERAQPPLAVLAMRLLRRVRVGDERADAALGGQYAVALEGEVDAGHRVGVDAQIDGQLADGGELIAGAELSGGEAHPDGALELRVER